MTRSLAVYDVIIRLHGRRIARRQRKRKLSDCEQIPRANEQHLPIVDFDPVSIYVRELSETYKSNAMFFYDRYGGDVVGVVWKPKMKQQQQEVCYCLLWLYKCFLE